MRGSQRARVLKHEYAQWRKINGTKKIPFFMLFEPVLSLLPDLKPGALKLYLFLGMKAKNDTGEVFWGVNRMAEELKVDERTIRAWLEELDEKKLIERIRLRAGSTVHTFLRPYGPTSVDLPTLATQDPQLAVAEK